MHLFTTSSRCVWRMTWRRGPACLLRECCKYLLLKLSDDALQAAEQLLWYRVISAASTSLWPHHPRDPEQNKNQSQRIEEDQRTIPPDIVTRPFGTEVADGDHYDGDQHRQRVFKDI